MTAKISDLGVARILNLTPLQVSRMTQTPGTPAYMPPEVMIANPKYDTSVDEFSYGILMIHMFSSMWPEPQVGPIRTESGKMIPVSEAERREVFIRAIGNDHPLMNLIHRCINNDPQLRPRASEIVGQLTEVKLQFPASFANRLEMLRCIEVQEEEKRALREEGERKDRQNEEQISIYRNDVQAKDQKKAAEINQLKVVHSCEVEQLRLQVRDLNAQNQLLNDEKEAEVAELKSKVTAYETLIENNAKTLLQEREQFDTQLNKEREHFEKALAKKTEEFETQLAKEREEFETQLAKKTEASETQLAKEREQFETQAAKEREQLELQLAKEKEKFETWLAKKIEESEKQLAKEREVSRKLASENHDLLSEVSKLRTKTDTLQHTISTLKADVMLKDGNISSKDAAITRKESELEAKIGVLQEKDAIISGCLLYTSPSPRDATLSRMPSSA